MTKSYSKFLSILFFVFLFFLAACGGGGGGSDSGSSSSSDGPLSRSTSTALRLLHGSVDTSALDIRIGDKYIQRGHFAEVQRYASVDSGPQVLTIERGNSPGVVVANVSVDFQKDTEYSLLAYGRASDSSLSFSVIPEPVARAEAGYGRFKLVNTLVNSDDLIANSGDALTNPVPFSLSSEFVETTSGIKEFVVTTEGGSEVARFTTEVPDRGDITILITGSNSLGVRFAKVFADLD